MKNANRGNKMADDYHKMIGFGERELPMKLESKGNAVRSESGIPERKLDIGDISNKKAIEVKDYLSKEVPYS